MSAEAVDAIRILYDDHARSLFAYLARRVGRDLAEDLLADTYRAALESYRTFDSERGAERAWLYGIATNLLRRHWRTERRHLLALERSARLSSNEIDPLIAVADFVALRVDAASDVSRVLAAFVHLSADDRDLLLLSGWEHLNSTEIGQALGMPSATVRSRLHRIRTHLRDASGSINPHDHTSSGVP